MFQKTAKDVHRAIELWANEQKSETTSDPVAVATTFRDNYERIGATCGRVNYIQTLKGLIVIFHESLAFKQRVLDRLRITGIATT